MCPASRRRCEDEHMAKSSKAKAVNETEKVNAYISELQHPLKAEMEAVRAIILNTDSKIMERIKWNAPSFFYRGDLGAFNPRTTKFVQLIIVYPKDTVIRDSTGLLQGDYKDRREARFYDMADVQAKKAALEQVVKDWITIVEQ